MADITSAIFILKVTTAETVSDIFMQLEDLEFSITSIHKPISQTIGNAIHITDNETNFGNQLQGQVLGIEIRGCSSPAKAKYEAPKIEFGKIRVSSTVSVKYILK